ncbi:hypothetical protein [Tateyamaria sp. ANG-S1]|uniref:hypothetical protein n=1 Tax=Tateyamaria sp. ANG-S1 TaxID=1577905 RepID=UPI0005806B53|nr:hypothetical protein [Tateyamaria sp. ANG-S1]KIC49078.1 hypothetical protein RA29_15765 [Tateyamaria sp. ANG-S1]
MTSTTTHVPPQKSFLWGGIEAVKDVAKTITPALIGTEARVLYVMLALVSLWGLAIATWGYPALIIVAVGLVPVMFGVLLLITVGK